MHGFIHKYCFTNIGNELNPDSLRRILNEEGIKDTDWPEIVECLEQDPDLRSTFVGGILIRIQECPSDKTDLWLKIAGIFEGMEAAARKARKNAGTRVLSKISIFLKI